MEIGIAIFAYCRDEHLNKVLCGLKKNKEVDKIYVFQDGLRDDACKEGWLRTSKVIESIDWCDVIYVKAERNYGLKNSIIKGIKYVLEDNEAVIIIEDDCVPMPSFITYMRQGLEKYKNDTRVFHLNGYARPFQLEKDDTDVYFNEKMGCWGWGTWKNRWEKFDCQKDYLSLLHTDVEWSVRTAAWSGYSMEAILSDSVEGKNDTWDVWWALNIMENHGLCINPYESLIDNIGFDGGGTNCRSKSNAYKSELNEKIVEDFVFPKEVKVRESVLMSFAEHGWGSYTALKTMYMSGEISAECADPNWNDCQEQIVIYGLGNGFHTYEKELNCKYKIIAFSDSNKKGLYAGLHIIPPNKIRDILEGENAKLVISLLDEKVSARIRDNLIEKYEIDQEKVLILRDAL